MADITQVIDLQVEMLQANPLQPRSLITPDSLKDLSASIKETGILEPLIVAKTPAGYQIIAGERRWRAAKLAGLKSVPVIIKETTARGMLEMALIENVQREDLNPLERAQAFERLIEEFGLPVSEIAKRVGKSDSYVSNTLRLLTLPDAIKDGLMSNAISEGHARAIAGLGDVKLMVEAYKQILADSSSVRKTEDLVRRLKAKHAKAIRQKTERIHNEELDKIASDLAQVADGLVKITQSKVEARLVIIIRGNLEKTSQRIKKIHQLITTESS